MLCCQISICNPQPLTKYFILVSCAEFMENTKHSIVCQGLKSFFSANKAFLTELTLYVVSIHFFDQIHPSNVQQTLLHHIKSFRRNGVELLQFGDHVQESLSKEERGTA